MTTHFRTLFTLKIAHGYYSGECRDFEFLLTASTLPLIKNGHLIAKVVEGKLFVLFEAREADQAVSPIAGKTLRVGLKLLNPLFSNITKTGGDPGATVPLYRNLASPDELSAPENVTIAGHLVSHTVAEATRPVTVNLISVDGILVDTVSITSSNNRKEVSFDLTHQRCGRYMIEEVYPAKSNAFAYYVDPEFLSQGVFGVVEIQVDEMFYSSPPEFTISFEPRTETLKYYVVAKNYSATEFNQLSVDDSGFSEDARPQVNFIKVSSLSADDISPELLGDNSSMIVLFKSQNEIPRQEKPRRKIQLKKNNQVLITHLPQPGADRHTADLIINISKS